MKSTAPLLAAVWCVLTAVTACAIDPHVDAVIRIVEGARGKVEKTEDGQSLTLVDLAVPGAGPHDHRKEDPYDVAFFEHLGRLTRLKGLEIGSANATPASLQHIQALPGAAVNF
jgi:hypothetical protein